MDRLDAFVRILERARMSGDDEFMRDVSALVCVTPHAPPEAIGVLGGTVYDLAHQIREIAPLPMVTAEAHQALVFRLVRVLEAYEKVMEPVSDNTGRRIKQLGQLWAMTAWEQCSPDSVAQLMMSWAKHDPSLMRELNRIDHEMRRGATAGAKNGAHRE